MKYKYCYPINMIIHFDEVVMNGYCLFIIRNSIHVILPLSF